jgi:predicted dienelactone hydrolase
MSKVTKERLQKLLDNVDMEKLNNLESYNTLLTNAMMTVTCLEQCQKEPTLHDKLVARGFSKVIDDETVITTLRKSLGGWHYIDFKLNKLSFINKTNKTVSEVYPENEQQLFEAIDLFEKWSKDES